MSELTMTKNGRVVIPKAMRDQLGLHEGDEMIAEIEDATNLAELISKVIERGLPASEVPILVSSLNVEIIPLTQEQAELAGILRQPTRQLGLSLGDRACLALAKTLGGRAITADRPRQALDLGIAIECIRPENNA
ncbi:hypothetical protein ACCAA_50135 [Candidatus Accumulibacter aalborgensis]|uniref:SpoVT-AbrB domain-containing protein n=1 Tax=Candidatus Accumulibacter aalborgensis TaxID=1860102 RepID=A0A1A8XTP6_9PROT|nr:AbrB/MazE/SpoVT family DNA-binding domain-containing protein [Candidatus Accumulibacter aalborgensis]SBT07907.1 hypothetical protein ACCAA_50135 [Candidatus Accumulibacter aalborgensis]